MFLKKLSHISLAFGFMLSTPPNLLNLPGSRCKEALILRGRRGSGWIEAHWAYLCNFLSLFLLADFITAAHFLSHQSENDSPACLSLLFLIISELTDTCDTLETVFRVKGPNSAFPSQQKVLKTHSNKSPTRAALC